MTYNEWADCADPFQMLDVLEGNVSDRRLRLLNSGWIRFSFSSAAENTIVSLLDRADAVADGAELSEALAQLLALFREVPGFTSDNAHVATIEHAVFGHPYFSARYLMSGRGPSVRASFCHIIRCVFGNPWPHPVREKYPRLKAVGLELLKLVAGHPNFRNTSTTDEPTWLDSSPFEEDWRTSTAVALAQQMYNSRDFSAMAILADALQDAGCDNAEILDHCRVPGPHVRGCWVVDLVLGKS